MDPKAGRAFFYYFVESSQNSSYKPLVLRLNGSKLKHKQLDQRNLVILISRIEISKYGAPSNMFICKMNRQKHIYLIIVSSTQSTLFDLSDLGNWPLG